MSNQLQQSSWGHRLGWCLSVLGLAGALSLSAQSYQASYSLDQAPVEVGKVGKGSFTLNGEELLMIGTSGSSANGAVTSVPVLTLSPDGSIISQFELQAPGSRSGGQLEGAAISDNGEGEYFLGLNLVSSGRSGGIVAQVNHEGKARWSSAWEGSGVTDLAFHPRTGAVLAVGNGVDRMGREDLRMGMFDSEGKMISSNSVETDGADGAVAVVPLQDDAGYLVAGYRQLRTMEPMLFYVNENGQPEWSYTFLLDRPVASVGGLAYDAERGIVALAGSALTDNRDTTTFVLIANLDGEVTSVFYYDLPGHIHSFGNSIVAAGEYDDRPGFLVAGSMKPSGTRDKSQSLLFHLGFEGELNWIRTYGPRDLEGLVNDGFTHVTFNQKTGEYAALGYEYASSRGQGSEFRLKAVKAYPREGLAGENAGFCADEVEVLPQKGEGEVRLLGAMSSFQEEGSQVALNLERSAWGVNYCSYPLRTRTTTEVVEAAALDQAHRARVYDLQGRLLHQATVAAGEELVLPSFLPRGVYIVQKVVNGQVVGTEKRMQVQP